MALAANARLAAADLLVRVLEERRSLDQALGESPHLGGLDPRDRAFARAIASSTLRHLGRIDAVLAGFLLKPLPQDAMDARALLRSGAAQLLAMDLPAHAVVSETVELANAHPSTRGFAKLMNAVLRHVARDGSPRFTALPMLANLPEWLGVRWSAAYGAQSAQAMAKALAHEAPLDLTPRHGAEALAARLDASLVLGRSVRLAGNVQAIPSLPGFAEGEFWVQDAAAALPACLIPCQPGQSVIDLCAAPGGKAMQLARAGFQVTALDHAPDRVRMLRENARRTGLALSILEANALEWCPDALVDAVLLDAPCSATGTLRRHPEAAWLRGPQHITRHAQGQRALLAAAAAMLKPQGWLVYAVCSQEPEEGEAILDEAAALGLQQVPIQALEIGGLDAAITPAGAVRTRPDMLAEQGGLDGFFIARWRKMQN